MKKGADPRNWVWAVLFLTAALALAFWPVMARRQSLLPLMAGTMPFAPGPKFMLDPFAPAWFSYPLGVLAARIWSEGALPLWNGFSSCGEPLLAGVHAGITSPFRLWYVLAGPTPGLWDAYCLSRLLVAGLGTFWLASVLGLGVAAALTSAIAYMLSGFMVVNISLSLLDADALLPVLAVFLVRLMRRPRPGAWTGCAVAGGAILLLGNPQVALVDGVFAAFLVFVPAFRSGPSGTARRLIPPLVAGGAALLLAAPALLPVLEFLPRAQHIHEEAGRTALPLWGSLSLAAPWILGEFGRAWGGVNPFLFLPHAGATVLILAAFGVRRAWRTPEGAAFCLVPLFMLAATYGIPPASWLGRLPAFSLLWWAQYEAPTYLGLAVLAGFGAEALARSVARRAPAAGMAVMAVAGELLMLVPSDRPFVHDPLTSVPYVEFLKKEMDPLEDRLYATGLWLHPHTGAALGLRDVRSFYGVMPRRTYWYVRALVTGPAPDSHSALMTGSLQAKPAIDSPALSALAVRWLVTDSKAVSGGIQRRFLRRFSGAALVYENLEAQPRARVVERAVRVPDAGSALYETSGAPSDPRTIFVEGPPSWPGFAVKGVAARARILSEGANEVTCRVPGAGVRILLLADSWEPGWKAFAGARRLMVLPANCMFRAVAVPDGDSDVVFRYEPIPVKAGILACGFAGGALLPAFALTFLPACAPGRPRRRKN